MQYYNLNVHSCYDLLNSTIKLEELFSKLAKNNINYVSIADPNMYSAIKSHRLAKRYNINLAHALEAKVSYELDFLTLNIICRNEKMFKKLLEISSRVQTVDQELTIFELTQLLQNYKQDCILLITTEIKSPADITYLGKELAGFNYFFSFNEKYNYSLYTNVKNIVYSKPSYYLNFNDYQPLVVARAIKENKKLNVEELTTFTGEDFVYTNKDIEKLLANIINPLQKEILVQSITNQQYIVKNSIYNLDLSGYHLPKYTYSEQEAIFKGQSSADYLKYLVIKGAKKKLVGKEVRPYKLRFEYELSVINDMGFADYFLIVYDFVKYAKERGIYVGAGRGSAVGSLVCYLLDITEVDPLEYNLLFERFLNKERISMPDIDIDFQDTKRDEVIKYVEEKYGKDKVAQIITFTTFQSKSAARESARILQFPETTLKKISTMISSTRTLTECYEESSELREFVHSSEYNERWFTVAKSLEHLPRNTSTHAAGVVISDNKNLVEYTALEKSNVTNYLTQWTMDDVEYVGLLKIDFLGIRYLTMLENISNEVKKYNPEFDINNINLRDKQVYKLFAQGKTEGIFQFESGGMKEKLRLLKPTEFNDIVAMNALYRPGPMAQIETYVRRKHGLEKIEYPHPKLENILKDTYGVIVYQEQIMLIAVNFANMTLTEADNMRRAVSKKKKEDLEKYGRLFVEKSVSAGYSLDVARNLFELIVTFANYGFNKSHAVAYSMLAYKLAYLKVYYPQYFMTALLNNVISNEQKINEYKQELNNAGIKLLNPDVNKSAIDFSVYKKYILFALVAIKNVGTRSATEIVADREKYGKYIDVDDFLRRMNKKVDYQAAISLVKAGALDTFGYNRATLMNKVKDYYEDTRENIDDVRLAIAGISGLTIKVEEVEDYTIQEKIKMEKEVTGTYFLKHPAQLEKEKYHYLPLKYLGNKESDSYVEIINIKEIKTKKGDYMAFLTVNDGRGDYDVTIFPSVYKYANVLLKKHQFLVLTVKPQIRNERMQYILEKITTLENYYNFCITNIKQVYVQLTEENKNFIKNHLVPDSNVEIVIVSQEDIKKQTIKRIKNEQEFVRNFVVTYPETPIKIGYSGNKER